MSYRTMFNQHEFASTAQSNIGEAPMGMTGSDFGKDKTGVDHLSHFLILSACSFVDN